MFVMQNQMSEAWKPENVNASLARNEWNCIFIRIFKKEEKQNVVLVAFIR